MIQLNESKTVRWYSIALFVVFGFVLLMALLTSCSPTKRIGALAAKHPDKARAVCVDMFPPKIETRTETQYITGTPTYVTDTVFANCDTVIRWIEGKPITTVRRVSVPCPPSIHRVDTFVKTEVKTIENTAKIDVLTKDLSEAKTEAGRLREGRNRWRWIAIGLGVILVGATVLKLYFGKIKKVKDALM